MLRVLRQDGLLSMQEVGAHPAVITTIVAKFAGSPKSTRFVGYMIHELETAVVNTFKAEQDVQPIL
jgi:hypothetical protein